MSGELSDDDHLTDTFINVKKSSYSHANKVNKCVKLINKQTVIQSIYFLN